MTTDSRYFAQKAIDAADALWDEGLIDEKTIEQWKHEHMRTPYSELDKAILDIKEGQCQELRYIGEYDELFGGLGMH